MEDSFDLFGGLPSAGGSGGGNSGSAKEENSLPPPPPPPKMSEVSAPISNAVTDTNTQPKEQAKPDAPTTKEPAAKKKEKPDVDDDDPPEKQKDGTSLVTAIGNSGTAMAFVPQAIRKKKKVAPQQKQPPPPPKPVPLKKRKFVGAIIETHEQNQRHNANKMAFERSNSSEIKWEENTNNIKESNDNIHAAEGGDIEPYVENEPEALRLLHASVTPQNQYNPHCPNDYLAWRERKKTEQVRKDLQQKALQRLDQQEKMRKKIEEERKKILQSGDLTKIADGAGVGRGRGRGRGASNLPAWLVKKQQEQQEAESAGSKANNDGQFDNA